MIFNIIYLKIGEKMRVLFVRLLATFLAFTLTLSACAAPTEKSPTAHASLKVLAIESFLADIAQNVAGKRAVIDTLIPIGVDPHSFQPTPQDVAKIAESAVLLINGAHFEEWLAKTLENAGGSQRVIEASAGLTSRQPTANEIIDPDHAGDPHFWLDPNNVIQYVNNIRDGLTQADPAGKTEYAQNAEQYISQLKNLDIWIKAQVGQIPAGNRLLVTNHESLGYFADRYGFAIAGTVIPSTSSEASPSAQQMAALIDKIKSSGAKAIFLESGANPQLADQIASETGVKVISDLYTHSTTGPEGEAPTYLEMMKRNVEKIVAALK
jgi:ABC-type Zn uptake system ZnuABC Zn-binding protein ZnuA